MCLGGGTIPRSQVACLSDSLPTSYIVSGMKKSNWVRRFFFLVIVCCHVIVPTLVGPGVLIIFFMCCSHPTEQTRQAKERRQASTGRSPHSSNRKEFRKKKSHPPFQQNTQARFFLDRESSSFSCSVFRTYPFLLFGMSNK